MKTTVKPSDVINSAADEVGLCITKTRNKLMYSQGEERERLNVALELQRGKLQELMDHAIRGIDSDPRIKASVQQLALLTQELAKVKREMITAKKIIDRAANVARWVDMIIGILSGG